MSAKIYAFPVARHVTVVAALVVEYVERLNHPSDAIAYLQNAFEEIAISQRQCGLDEDDIRGELLDLLNEIVGETYRLFDLDVSGIEVEVPLLDAAFAYDKFELSAG